MDAFHREIEITPFLNKINKNYKGCEKEWGTQHFIENSDQCHLKKW